MNSLPVPVENVVVPVAFSPSKLAHAVECRLRAVFAALGSSVPQLPTHPAAERGSVFHRLLELASRGLLARSPDLRATIQNDLFVLLHEARERLSSNPTTAHFAKLEEAFSPIEWHNAVQEIVAVAERLVAAVQIGGSSSTADPNSTYNFRFDRLRGNGQWSEVPIDAPSIRLNGKMDSLERRQANVITVRDYKTGQIHDRDGSVRSQIALQLRLYALAILAIEPSAQVRLFASDGTADYPVPLNETIIAETKQWLEAILLSLPAGAEVQTTDIATPGPSCSFCPSRHVCPAYRQAATEYWRSGSDRHSLPFDIWGAVTKAGAEKELITLDLVDGAERRIKVHRLLQRHFALNDIKPGTVLHFFGLSATPKNVAHGRFFHPRNFFELPSDSSERRAWSLAIFAG